MSKPDVRIRLSAEGVQEVVNALKSVQSQAGKAKTSVERSASGFDRAAKSVATLSASVKALAGLAAVASTLNFARTFVDNAAAMSAFSQQTGLTVERFSQLAYAAESAGFSAEQFADVLNTLSEKVAQAASGSGEAYEAFERIGVSVRDAAGEIKPLDRLLSELADKFSKYRDSAAKSATAQALFGDAGVRLIPVLNQGSRGLAEAADKADRLGRTMSDDAARAADELNAEMRDLRDSATSFARTIASKVIRELNMLITRFRQAREAGKGVFESLGNALFGTVKAENLRQAEQLARSHIETLTRLRDSQARSPSAEHREFWQAQIDKVQGELDGTLKLIRELKKVEQSDALKPDMPAPAAEPGSGRGKTGPDTAGRVAKARLEAQQAAAANELAIVRARNALTESEDRRSYEKGLQSLDDYNSARVARIEAEFAAEMAIAQQRIDAANAMPEGTEEERLVKQRALTEALSQAQLAQIEHTRALAEASAEHAREMDELNRQYDEHIRTQLERTGNVAKAELMALEDEIKALDELMRKRGASNEEREREIELMRKRGEARINVGEAQRNADDSLFELERMTREVERLKETGQIWGSAATLKILELEKARIPVLEEIAEKMREAAEASEDPRLIEQAQRFNEAIQDMKVSVDVYGQAIAKLRATIEESTASGLNNFFENIITGSMSAKEAMREFAFEVVNSIRRMAQELLTQHLVQQFFGMIGGGMGSGGAMGGMGGGGGIPGFATGGAVRGPGTGTSDSIPAWLSNGEFVVRAAVVRKPGVLEMLNALNAGVNLSPSISAFSPAPRMADGGLFGDMHQALGGGDGGGTSRIEVGLEDGLIVKAMQTPAGQRAIVTAIGKNKKAVRQVSA